MKLLFSIAVGLAAIMEAIALEEAEASNNKHISDIFRSLKTVENGFFHLGDDKILRTFDGDGNVLDYARPEDTHLKAVANLYSKSVQEHLYRVWGPVDDSQISEEQILHPPDYLLPLHLSKMPAAEPGICERDLDSGLEKRARCNTITCNTHEECYQRGCPGCLLIDKVVDGKCLSW
ncbi:hypothetical protein EMCG_01506 [[Emmonsia] crescens]|uniref:Uncharacterized protein n=1 Tax=[Emmonsia] crescens TaxID=73230 RepID=A0A0G2I1A4_9EURO|nr:hypothetical protein EMCG_01506 [Emmonsia crescens UAMH 3008]